MSNRLTDQEKNYIVQQKLKGTGSRAIGKVLGRGKSTVNGYYNQWREEQVEGEALPDGAKVLFLDLEVSASLVAAFSMFRHFSTPDHVIEFPYILTYGVNWLHEDSDKIECKGLNDFDLFKKDHKNDKELVLALWHYFDDADIVVIQNEGFDRGWFTQRCAYHGFPEPSPYRVICTLKGVKKAMSLPSNSLGYTTKYFDLPHTKLHHEGISLWIKCMEGDVQAFEDMKTYNEGDIPTLRELYLKVRAYIPNHPNIALYFGDKDVMRCSVCGSTNVKELDTSAFTNLTEFKAYRCGDCGTVKRSNESLTTKEDRNKFLRNIVK